MKAAVVICLIAIIATANATSLMEKFSFSYGEKRSFMKVMLQVEAMMKANGPMDLITDTLDEFEQEITAEQIQHDQLHDRQVKECEDEISFRQDEIDDAGSALAEGTETLDGCVSQLNRAKSDLVTTRKNLNENINQLTASNTKRRQENYNFETFVGLYNMIKRGIEIAQEFLDKLFSGEEVFAQITKHTNAMLIQASKFRKAHYMSSIIAALSQLGQAEVQANQELLNKLVKLFAELDQKYDDEMEEKQQIENEAQSKYETNKARLEDTISRLQTTQADLEDEIESLKKCVTVQTNIVSLAQQKIDRNARLQNDAVQLCSAEQRQYDYAKKARRDELDLLAMIRAKVEEHFAEISGGVTERGEQDEEEWAEDDVSYEKEEFVPTY